MSKRILTSLFYDIYRDINTDNHTKVKLNKMNNFDEMLEEKLKEHIKEVMGYSVYKEILQVENDQIDKITCIPQIRKCIQNIIVNYPAGGNENIIEWIDSYYKLQKEEMENHKLTYLFFEAAKNVMTNKNSKAIVSNCGKEYIISVPEERYEESVPMIKVRNIDNMEHILESFMMSIVLGDNYYKEPLENLGTYEEKIKYVLRWVLLNASTYDMNYIEKFFMKYIHFVNDKMFESYKHPVKIGDFMGDELYVAEKKSTVAYETPFYLSFMLANNRVELPNVRMGIYRTEDNTPIAEILALQTSQDRRSKDREKEINNTIKRLLPRYKYFREYNPSHVLSLAITVGLLNGLGIKQIEFPDYLSLRYNRYVLESQMSEEELYDYQHRLTNKFTNNFMRLIEASDGIDMISYPEAGNLGIIKLSDNITFTSELLQKMYNMGYASASKNKENKEKTKGTI